MKQSETIMKLMGDLVKAQTEMGSARKGSKNPFFHSTYADLGSIIEVCKDVLNNNNIVYLQPVDGLCVTTILIHSSGEWISDDGTNIICAKPNDPQAYGSAITYARRYGLQSFLGIPAEDDDGEKAMDRKQQAIPSKPTTEATEDISLTCSQCGDVITDKVLDFSQKKYGKALCFKCQKAVT